MKRVRKLVVTITRFEKYGEVKMPNGVEERAIMIAGNMLAEKGVCLRKGYKYCAGVKARGHCGWCNARGLILAAIHEQENDEKKEGRKPYVGDYRGEL